ncbi:MAG: 23S rRNA (pseudouridine(1915)-N(3))-methyltransferase RlmH [Muribaculaceae bacterium]|nr:23S rRNA (pseudouridine(1915)-N(3))-methyltransferase RlmH [Muribaculaceae bacterium]
MKITLLVVGKTVTGYLKQGTDEYASRLSHYVPFEMVYINDIKKSRSLTEAQQKLAEGRQILSIIDNNDYVVLLDERGTERTSVDFSTYIQKRMASGVKRTVFVVGGPFGFSEEVYARANDKLSVSKMTFPHELVRVIFLEQLYRAFTILNHEPYHHV